MKKFVTLISGEKSLNFYLEDEEFQFDITSNHIELDLITRYFTINRTLYNLTLSKEEEESIINYYDDNGLDLKPDLESILNLDFFKHLRIRLLTNLSALFHEVLYANQCFIRIDALFDEVLEEFERDLKNEFKVHF